MWTIEVKGNKVIISKNCFGKNNYFSGSDEERSADLQFGIDHEEVKAIFCARGGYGSVRILDSLNWANMLREPKWLVGYSDITVFHQRLNKLGVQSIHGIMPFNYGSNSNQALTSLFSALENTNYTISAKLNESNCHGKANGMLIGGNLSIVYSLLGTNDSYLFEDKIYYYTFENQLSTRININEKTTTTALDMIKTGWRLSHAIKTSQSAQLESFNFLLIFEK